MPKKQRVIEGVGAGSLMALQAQLYRTQAGPTLYLRPAACVCAVQHRQLSKNQRLSFGTAQSGVRVQEPQKDDGRQCWYGTKRACP